MDESFSRFRINGRIRSDVTFDIKLLLHELDTRTDDQSLTPGKVTTKLVNVDGTWQLDAVE